MFRFLLYYLLLSENDTPLNEGESGVIDLD